MELGMAAKTLGLVYGAMFVWALFAAIFIVGPLIQSDTHIVMLNLWILYSVIFGIPLSLIVYLPIGHLLWYVFDITRLVNYGTAIISGAVIAIIFPLATGFLGNQNYFHISLMGIIGGLSGYISLNRALAHERVR